jgi:hypothetical protein
MPQIPVTVRSPLDKPLVLVETLRLATPAAGQELLYTFPPNSRTRIHSLLLRFLCDATAGNRYLRFIVTSPNGIIFVSNTATAIPPSELRYITLAPGIAYYAGSTAVPYVLIPFPPEILFLEGFTLTTFTDNLAAGDLIDIVTAQVLTQITTD